jgi:hypothetical protein
MIIGFLSSRSRRLPFKLFQVFVDELDRGGAFANSGGNTFPAWLVTGCPG